MASGNVPWLSILYGSLLGESSEELKLNSFSVHFPNPDTPLKTIYLIHVMKLRWVFPTNAALARH